MLFNKTLRCGWLVHGIVLQFICFQAKYTRENCVVSTFFHFKVIAKGNFVWQQIYGFVCETGIVIAVNLTRQREPPMMEITNNYKY